MKTQTARERYRLVSHSNIKENHSPIKLASKHLFKFFLK